MKLPKTLGLYFLETRKYSSYFALIASEGKLYWNRIGEPDFVRPKNFQKAFGQVENYGPDEPVDWGTEEFE